MLAEFDQTGRIKWATDLAQIPAKFGVSNVYGEIGTAFANSAVANLRFDIRQRAALGTITHVAMGGMRTNTRYGYVHRPVA